MEWNDCMEIVILCLRMSRVILSPPAAWISPFLFTDLQGDELSFSIQQFRASIPGFRFLLPSFNGSSCLSFQFYSVSQFLGGIWTSRQRKINE
jgi:hypothetical protein